MRDFGRYPDAWYRRIARRAGVPELWLEDAVQEIKLAVWQGRNARNAAIDVSRRLGPRFRDGQSRPLFRPLETWTPASYQHEHLDAWMDVQDLFRRLPKRLQRIAGAHLDGYRDVEIARAVGVCGRRAGQLREQALAALR